MTVKTDGHSFYESAFELTVESVADVIGVKVEVSALKSSNLSGLCSSVAPIAGALAYVGKARTASTEIGICGAIICTPDDVAKLPEGPVYLAHPHPQLAFADFVRAYLPKCEAGIQTTGPFISDKVPGAHVALTARLENDVVINPGVVVGHDVHIGAGSTIGANAVIGDRVRIGRNVVIGSGVQIQCAFIGDHVAIHPGTMIGQDGFGYFPSTKGLTKMPHVGRVIIQDRVEIGAGTAIDRGTIGDTVIGEGTKIDNLVQIAHNVRIGRFVILCGHVGISGSCTIGDGAMLGGGVGLADGLTIGAGAHVAGGSGVMDDIPDGQRWAGSPAQPMRALFKEVAALRKLAKGNKPS